MRAGRPESIQTMTLEQAAEEKREVKKELKELYQFKGKRVIVCIPKFSLWSWHPFKA